MLRLRIHLIELFYVLWNNKLLLKSENMLFKKQYGFQGKKATELVTIGIH